MSDIDEVLKQLDKIADNPFALEDKRVFARALALILRKLYP